MKPFNALQLTRNEVGISKYMPITHLLEPTIFEASNSMIGSVIQVAGVPFDTEREETLNRYQQTWHHALTGLNENFCLYVTTHRKKRSVVLTGKFSNSFSEQIDRNYHTRFANRSMYVNDLYITLVYKGITSGKAGKSMAFVNRLVSQKVKQAREVMRQDQVKALQKAVQQLLTSLSTFKPRVLDETAPSSPRKWGSRFEPRVLDETQTSDNELLSFLSLFINAGQPLRFLSMPFPTSIAKGIAQHQAKKHPYPNGNLSQYLANKRLFFGEDIQFVGANSTDTQFASMLTIKSYPTTSASIMLDPLLHLDCEFISTHTFAIEAKDIAQNFIHRHMIKMENVDDPAISQIEALTDAREMLASGAIQMGYHHNTVMLIAEDQKTLEKHRTRAIKCYADVGFQAIKETIGQEPAFWAQIPTNLKYIARSAMITSENFVDFAPLHNYRTGYRDANHLGSAVTLMETPSRTPYFFNFHARGSKDNPSKGHTTIIGGNGSGKTVLMTFLDAQIDRYGGRTFAFDRDRGMEIYIRACDGYYAILSPDYPNETCFNPLQLKDTPVNRKFCREWMAQLILNDHETSLDAELFDEITKCIDYAFEHLAKEHRTLTNVSKLLPISFPRWSALRRWLRGNENHPEGEYAYLFDNDHDALEMHTKMGFDMTHFLDNESSTVLVALTMYLFHRLKQSLDGRLVTVLLDEGWQYLDNAYWQQALKKMLPTFRKLNCHLVLATQSPASVVDSSISHVILDNCATQIYFANPQAKEKHYIDGFNLTDSEFLTIKENEANSRLFLVKQEHDSVLCTLDLSHMSDELAVLSSNKKTIRLLDQIREESVLPVKEWLPIFQERRHLQ
ncbi:MAG: VirB4 family type IV secretion/conjugal transfer ATPase [Gammaproteobacteria bacterium]|nr:VirB4 family type IV secretion/conjugal transfer ATPase [Gammaproteobacteria bacterium]MBU1629058.1 VirB4 family type IV secretion/conjugal transfer ATPase [Gammaproteobacteria bacterium]MBU1927076.1 VirB4 family type IV secretion/conjugal transfer ATPase [Gammaproteobacteria bacterium]MBU2546532.1 VirB4 family type IV secretion/conjugal transfer ATPase [Gammaproteobacteria bacterium]